MIIDRTNEIKEADAESTMRKVVSYCRSATVTQNHSKIEFQQKEIQKFADSHNWEIVEYFVDEGYSGNTFRRPDFMRMAEMAESNPEWTAILVYNESRLSRDFDKYACCERILKKHDVELIPVEKRRRQERYHAIFNK